MRSRALWVVAGTTFAVANCGPLVGIVDFGPANDGGGGPDGTVLDDSGLDAPTQSETGGDGGGDSSSDAGGEAADAGEVGDGSACTPGAQQCSANGIEIDTCDPSGQWTIQWACKSGACAGGACTNPPSTAASCQRPGDGLDDCGASSESCCTSLEVPGGTYFRTYMNTGNGATSEGDPATVGNVRFDKYDVTVGRFRQFVDAVSPPDGGPGWSPQEGSGTHAHLNSGSGLSDGQGGYEVGWSISDDGNVAPTTATLQSCDGYGMYATWTSTAQSNEKLPMTCANWYEAYAFCIWDGGFLPSEAEWEYAAVGGRQQLEYPWGSTPPGTANQYAIYDCYYGPASCSGFANIAPVGFAASGAGTWGQLDLTGNVEMWLLDGANLAPGYDDPCIDCADLAPSTQRRVRGAQAFADIADLPPATWSVAGESATLASPIGFRCARVP